MKPLRLRVFGLGFLAKMSRLIPAHSSPGSREEVIVLRNAIQIITCDILFRWF